MTGCPVAAKPKADKHGLTEMLQPNSYHAPVFQGGPRTCIGREMAYFEASLVLAMVLQKFSLRRKPGAPPVRPGESLVMPIAGGLDVFVSCRGDGDSNSNGAPRARL